MLFILAYNTLHTEIWNLQLRHKAKYEYCPTLTVPLCLWLSPRDGDPAVEVKVRDWREGNYQRQTDRGF